MTFRKPDMVIRKPGDNEATILDTQVVSDGSHLVTAHDRKVSKDDREQILKRVRQPASLAPSATVTVSSATLSGRGVLEPEQC